VNLAILIGVSDYASPVPKLPACKTDLALMARLIRNTNKFGDILEVGADTSSSSVKAQLAQFVKKHGGSGVDELFFYYSGHGDLFKDDFYFLFSDFSDKQRNQTSLTTEELDSMLRTLSPKLTVKVVDACHAGVTYVKEPDALKKQLTVSTGRFADCYFMFSSQSSQTSLQDDKLSDFTREFVVACTNFSGKEIRYRDIVDHISDAFATNPDQTPTFVIQAPCVEIFCSIEKSIRNLLQLTTARVRRRQSGSKPALGSAIAQAIQDRAAEFCTKEEVSHFLQSLGERMKGASFFSDLKDSYRLETELSETYEGIPDLGPIGKWVKEKGGDFFATPITGTEQYEVTDPFETYLRPATLTKPVMATREVITSFDCTAETPYKAIRVTAYPLYENLPHAVAVIVFVFSKRDCVVFYSFQTVKEMDWGKLAPIEGRRWTYATFAMKTDPDAKSAADSMIKLFEAFLTKQVKEKLGLVEDDSATAGGGEKAKAKKSDSETKTSSSETKK